MREAGKSHSLHWKRGCNESQKRLVVGLAMLTREPQKQITLNRRANESVNEKIRRMVVIVFSRIFRR